MLIYALQSFTATDGIVCTAGSTFTLTEAAGQNAINNGQAQRAEMPAFNGVVYTSGLKPTGYDQTKELQQYFNDTSKGNLHADFGAGDFIITGNLVIHSRKVTEYEGSRGFGLNIRGVAPNITRLLDVRADKTNPVILVTDPTGGTGLGTNNKRDNMMSMRDFSLLSCDPATGQPYPISSVATTTSGVGFMTKAVTGSGFGAHCIEFSKIERVIFAGYDYPLSLDDTTGIEINGCYFPSFVTALRMGGNADIWTVRHCAFGSEDYGTTYRNSSVAIDDAWDSGNGLGTGSANNMLVEKCWFMRHGLAYRSTAPASTVVFRGNYYERMQRYYLADISDGTSPKCNVQFDQCEFSQASQNDVASAVKNNAGYGAKIQFGLATAAVTSTSNGPIPILKISQCDMGTASVNALVSFNNRTGHIIWEQNNIAAASSYNHIRCVRDGLEAYRWCGSSEGSPNGLVGNWVFGDDASAGVRVLDGTPMVRAVTITAGGTYNIDQTNGMVFQITLPDGDCTINASSYAAGPPATGLLAAGQEFEIILIAPASVTATRTITWGGNLKMNTATLTYTATEQGKRAYVKVKCFKDSVQQLNIVSRDPVFL